MEQNSVSLHRLTGRIAIVTGASGGIGRAKELKGTGITANCVAPGPVATELFFEGKSEETINRLVDACPLGRLGDPNDMCGIVGLLASDAGEWINGEIIRVNGGFVV